MKKGRKQERQEQALERQAKYDTLNIDDKIKLVKSREGNSLKEFTRLSVNKRLEKSCG